MERCFNRPEALLPGTRPVVALGMFDGVHRGHRKVLDTAREWADTLGRPAAVLTFDIHPRRLLAPDRAPDMITTLEHRLALIERLGLDGACVLSFTPDLAATSADAFVRTLLVGGLRASGVVLGPRAHFGRGREGSVPFLRTREAVYGLPVREVAPVEVDGIPVSSTAIREAVRAGDLAAAADMLGRSPSVMGTVEHGRGFGRTLGFPTLNLDPHHELHPPGGVYVTRTRWGRTEWPSVTNIGHRPTVGASGPADVLIESFLLAFEGDLYGQTVEVAFLHRLRGEQHFSDPDALRDAIRADVDEAARWHDAHPDASVT